MLQLDLWAHCFSVLFNVIISKLGVAVWQHSGNNDLTAEEYLSFWLPNSRAKYSLADSLTTLVCSAVSKVPATLFGIVVRMHDFLLIRPSLFGPRQKQIRVSNPGIWEDGLLLDSRRRQKPTSTL